MPIININILKRNIEQKREIAKKVTDAIVDVTGFNRELVHIIFTDMNPENIARGGILAIDKDKE